MSTLAIPSRTSPPPTATGAKPLPTQPAGPGFIEQRWVHFLILGSFVVFTLPLCVLASTSDNFLRPWSVGWLYVCALGTTHRVGFIQQVAAHGMPFATVVHPKAHVSKKSTLGEGSFISVGAIISTHTRMGRHVFVNIGVLIGHHCTVGDYVTFGPGANVSGNCQIGEGSFLGVGAVVLNDLKIGAHSVIGAGVSVTKSVPPNTIVTVEKPSLRFREVPATRSA